MTTAAERIAKMMEDLGMDQPTFGGIAGATKSVVNQWLSGKIKSIDARYAFSIQRKKNYSAEWIMLGTGQPMLDKEGREIQSYAAAAPSDSVAQETPAIIQQLVACARAMTPEGQYILLGRAEELALRYPLPKANTAA